jgi:hypothetical protein
MKNNIILKKPNTHPPNLQPNQHLVSLIHLQKRRKKRKKPCKQNKNQPCKKGRKRKKQVREAWNGIKNNTKLIRPPI